MKSKKAQMDYLRGLYVNLCDLDGYISGNSKRELRVMDAESIGAKSSVKELRVLISMKVEDIGVNVKYNCLDNDALRRERNYLRGMLEKRERGERFLR